MRIGYLNQPWDTGTPPALTESIGICTWEIARCLARECEVMVCSRRERGQPATGTWEGVRYVRLALPGPATDRWLRLQSRYLDRFRDARRPSVASNARHLAYAVRAALAFRRNECDVVHIHNFSQFVPVVRRLNPRAKIVLHMNCDWLVQLEHKMIDKRLKEANAIVGCSEYVTNNIRRSFPHYADRCSTVFNGVNVERFEPSERRSNSSRKWRLVFVGRISPEKGLHILLDAFERLLVHWPNCRLEIIGPDSVAPKDFIVSLSDDSIVQELTRFYDKNYSAYLRGRVRGLLEDYVSFTGALPYSEVVGHMRRADLCVVPSVWNEPFGMPAVEAMSSGLPVIASRSGGLEEIVKDGETGLLVERNNPRMLAEALTAVLEKPELMRSMGRAGRQRAEQMFSWERIAEVLKRLYSQILESQ